MKKLLAIILSILMLMSLAACGNNPAAGSDTDTNASTDTGISTDTANDTEADTSADTEATVDNTVPFNITVISGTTGMGFAKMMDDVKNGTALFPYNFEIVSGADVVAPAIISGTTDIAAVPTNLAAVLYAKTNGEIRVLAANTLGVLYLIENGETVNSMSDLAGKTIYCCQQGANPEFITNYLLTESGLTVGTDVFLDFTYNNPDELATAIATGKVDLAVLPEPKVTATLAQNESLRRAINFSDVWEEVSGGLPLIQGCIIARKSFIDEHPAEVAAFLEEYKASIDFVNTNAEEASAMIAEAGIIPKAPLALKAIPNCNIAFISGSELAEPMKGFFGVLHAANPASVGGAIPADEIFYIAD